MTQMRRVLATVVTLAATGVALAGCSTVTSAYIALGEGGFRLTVPEGCDYRIQNVSVRYSDDDDDAGWDDLQTVWVAEGEDAASSAVDLFRANDGYTTEFAVPDVDYSRPMIIGWMESWPDGDHFTASLVGVLGDVENGEVLWWDGITSQETYGRETSKPWASFRC